MCLTANSIYLYKFCLLSEVCNVTNLRLDCLEKTLLQNSLHSQYVARKAAAAAKGAGVLQCISGTGPSLQSLVAALPVANTTSATPC